MRLAIRKLKFSIPDMPFGRNPQAIGELTTELKKVTKKAGTENSKFKAAFSEVYSSAKSSGDVQRHLNSKIHIRAFAIALQSDVGKRIKITDKLIEKINQLSPKPGSLLIDSLYQHFLNEFESLESPKALMEWLVWARRLRKTLEWYDENLISMDGPDWLAARAIDHDIDFDQQLVELELNHFSSGQFMTVSKRIYYVEQLRSIPVNSDHDLLLELQKKRVFESRYDENQLLGHQVLQILIGRAPDSDICDSWLNTIIAIAGDPRVPNSHHNYTKWWSHLSSKDIAKVRGWLSKLDLKLFLEALQNYSDSSGDDELQRMYPSRKRFLEGLFDAGYITHTRLYLSWSAANYLKRNYKPEHLLSFSSVDGNKSIIHVELDNRHIIEGSHSCYLWVYRSLDESATVFDYNKTSESYSGLTSRLGTAMANKGHPPVDKIQHLPANFNWQRKAVKAMNSIGVGIKMKDVLTDSDYSSFIRRFGVGP